MNYCIACGKDCQISGFESNNWFHVDCATYCAFEIHRVAIKRIEECEHEKNRFYLRLENACKEKQLLKISYQSSNSEKPTLKFTNEQRT